MYTHFVVRILLLSITLHIREKIFDIAMSNKISNRMDIMDIFFVTYMNT